MAKLSVMSAGLGGVPGDTRQGWWMQGAKLISVDEDVSVGQCGSTDKLLLWLCPLLGTLSMLLQ